jgi:hypothetical protein
MDQYEIGALSDAYYEHYKEGWEKVRTIAHVIMSSQSTKPLKPKDVLKFAWDDEQNETVDKKKKETPEEAKERLRKKFKK